jgi:hypothetical protein
MTKTFLVAALLSSFAAVSFAQGGLVSDQGASAVTAKHAAKHKAKKSHKAASAAEASADKK